MSKKPSCFILLRWLIVINIFMVPIHCTMDLSCNSHKVKKQNSNGTMDWQASCLDWKIRGATLLESGVWSDCEFAVGEQATLVKAHRLVLASASPVFAAMLYGPLAEGQFPVRIPDIEPTTFHKMLEFMYTDAVTSVPVDMVDDLMYASGKYLMPGLVHACGDALQSRVTAENATWTYELASKLEHQKLIDRCLEIFSKDTQTVLFSPAFQEAHVDTLAAIFSQQSLKIGDELELLTAMKRYAIANGFIDEEIADNIKEETFEQRTAIMRPPLRHVRLLAIPPSKWGTAQELLRLFLSKDELMAVMLNAMSSGVASLPEGFCTNRVGRIGDVPFVVALPRMSEPLTIKVQGIVPEFSPRFDINLQYELAFDDATLNGIPLHISVRFLEGCVVRNTYRPIPRGWGPEEREGGMPFHKGKPFNMTISWDCKEFTVEIDGSEFCTYRHRVPPTAVTHFGMCGDVQVINLSVE